MRTQQQIESQLYIANRISQNMVKFGVKHHLFHGIKTTDMVNARSKKEVILIFTANCKRAIETLCMSTGLGFYVRETATGKFGEYEVLWHEQVDVIVTSYHRQYRHLCTLPLQNQLTYSCRIYDIVDIVTDGKFTTMQKENKQVTIEEQFANLETKLQNVLGPSKLHWNTANIIRPVDNGNGNTVFHRVLAIKSMQASKVARLLSDTFTVQFTDYHGIVFLGFIDELPVRVYQAEPYDDTLRKVNSDLVAAGSLHRSMCLPHELGNCPDRSFVSKQPSYAISDDIMAMLMDCGLVVTGTTGGFKTDGYDFIMTISGDSIPVVEAMLKDVYGIDLVPLLERYAIGYIGKVIIVTRNKKRPYVKHKHKDKDIFDIVRMFVNEGKDKVMDNANRGVKVVVDVAAGPTEKLLEETAAALKHPDAIGRVYTGAAANKLSTHPVDPAVEEIIVAMQELKIFNTSLEANIDFNGYTKILRVSNLHYDGRQVNAVDITNILKGKFDKVFEVDFYIGGKAVVLFHKYVMVLIDGTRGTAKFPIEVLNQCYNLIEDHVKSEKTMRKKNDKTVKGANKKATVNNQAKVKENPPFIDIVKSMIKLEFTSTIKQYDFSHSKYKQVLYINDVRNARHERLYAGYVAGCLSKILGNVVFEEAKCANTYFFAFYHDLIVVIGDEVFNGDRLSGEVYYLCYNLTAAVDTDWSEIDSAQRGEPVILKRHVLGQDATKKSEDTPQVVIEHELVSDEVAQMVADATTADDSNKTEPAFVGKIKEAILKVVSSESEESKQFPKKNYDRHVVDVKFDETNGANLYLHPVDYTGLDVTDTIAKLAISTMQHNNMHSLPTFAEVVEEQRHGLLGLTKPVYNKLGAIRWINRALHFAQTCYYKAENGDVAHLLCFVADDYRHFVIASYMRNGTGKDDSVINVYEIVPFGMLPTKDVTLDWVFDVLKS